MPRFPPVVGRWVRAEVARDWAEASAVGVAWWLVVHGLCVVAAACAGRRWRARQRRRVGPMEGEEVVLGRDGVEELGERAMGPGEEFDWDHCSGGYVEEMGAVASRPSV